MKVLVGISGGFDSAYSVLRLLSEGHTVEGAVLDMHAYTEVAEARMLAEKLGIPLHVISCHALFEEKVIDHFCKEYLSARTPNPCVRCNETVKFKALFDYAMENGFDRIATGLYSNIVEENGRHAIVAAEDAKKDQSYMLYRLPEKILAKLMLPMGNIIKKEAKEEGRAIGLSAADREESQEICFVRNESYADFIERRCGKTPPGDFVSEDGRVLGKHNGILRYTVGQRKGLGISAASRLFIHHIDKEENKIYLSERMPDTRIFVLEDAVFSGLTKEEALNSDSLLVRVRYSAPMVKVRVWEKDGRIFGELTEFSGCAVTPGQSAVFYEKDKIAFGGIIESTLKTHK